jgi:hypothetical protein
MQRACEGRENRNLRKQARRLGRPALFESINELPALGSESACVLGQACAGINIYKKIPNGWK